MYFNGVEFGTKVLVVKETDVPDFTMKEGIEFIVIPPRYEEDIKNLIWFKITKNPYDRPGEREFDDGISITGETSNMSLWEFDEGIKEGSLKII